MLMKRLNTRLESLERDIRKITIDQDTQQAVAELEAWHKNMVMKYNSVSERDRRHRKYKELQKLGKLRKQAFDQGDPMAKYPLPWEKSL